ncbi:PHB depolymerase family esterase [Mucilaginibacter sp.]|uniref:alpha/beta hydrolase family esterase n=1 Tax=Mucilaginibacter sp. TaxID=1882438 RepID=UPI00263A0EF8|nr:PHB depolymerase family esterase [Mucilaginibacter sp.]MDB4926137.1 Polyhydroxybutyrate depolymerase [Mucilaginibacter sp.]
MSALAQSSMQLIKGDMIIDGNKRSFLTYVPFTDEPDKMPLVISLHGGFASPKSMFHLANFRPVAEREKFIVVCPASKNIWHDGADIHSIDDVKFIDHLITYIIKTYHADPERVYITGISNGGFMTTRLACQLHQRIAAIAVVAATLDMGQGYDLTSPMPALYMHGTKDPVVSYKGGKLFGRGAYSHEEIIEKWVALNDCDKVPLVTNIPDTAHDGTSILKEEYHNPKNGLKVISYTINNGGHTWPGGWQYFPEFIIGKTTRNLNACEEIWNFFKPYKLSLKNQPTTFIVR